MATVQTLQAGVEPYPGYRLKRPLGRGAYAEVWEARTADGAAVALKFVPCEDSRKATQEMRALQAVRQLRHPNLIRIDRVWGYSHYIVVAMELADGSLADLLEVYQSEFNTPIVPGQASHYLVQAAEALDFLNTRQHPFEGRCVAIQHCNVKPSNLLVCGDVVKLADFGLSALTAASLEFHRRAGTLHYTAPEVFQGRLSDRTDQYALAVTYCEIRSGRLPFNDTPRRFDASYVRPAPDLSMLPAAEGRIVARALAPDPLARWPSCRDFAYELVRLT